MATTKPRITVTLNQEQYQVLQTISAASGQSMSGVLVEFIQAALPTFERMAATFVRAKQAVQVDRARVTQALDEAQAALEPLALAAIDQFDLFATALDGAIAPAASPRAAQAAAPDRGRHAPLTNRGDTPPGKNGLKPLRDKASMPVLKKEVLKKTAECTCHITKHERQENRSCPVHFPKAAKR